MFGSEGFRRACYNSVINCLHTLIHYLYDIDLIRRMGFCQEVDRHSGYIRNTEASCCFASASHPRRRF